MTVKFYVNNTLTKYRILENVCRIEVLGDTRDDALDWLDLMSRNPDASPMLNCNFYDKGEDRWNWISIPIELVMSIE